MSNIHTDDGVVAVAGDVKPGTGIHKGWIPAFQNVVRVLPCLPLRVKDVTFGRYRINKLQVSTEI